jgi:hypothetical protein
MNTSPKQDEDRKTKIIEQIAGLSRLLGMIPSDDKVIMREPQTQNELFISDWFSATRDSFLQLSTLIGKELDIRLQ